MMRKALIILFSILTIPLWATDYYVKSTGNDSNTGLSDAQAWKTITKVNTVWAAGTFAPGDNIYFRRGDTFYGTLTVTESGTSANNITIGAYGTGNNPVLSGFQVTSSWSDPESDGIYVHSLSPESTPNILLLDGVNTPLGRYPDHTYLDVESATTTTLTDTELPSSPDFDGAQVVIRTWYWMLEKSTIFNHTGTSITHGSNRYAPRPGYGFFIQNHFNCLTLYGEWSYDGDVYLYFGGEDPDDHEVRVSVRDQVININGYNYITIQDLTIEGGNARNIYLQGADNITVKDCKIRFSGANGVQANSSCDYVTIQDCEVIENNNVGLYIGGGHHATITRNYLSKNGYYPGMGGSSDQDYSGIICRGSYGTITYNDIYDSGYDGIVFGGQGTNVSYNYIDRVCFVKDDGGGIYSYRDYNTGKTVNYNIILNSSGADAAIGEGNDRANGIYNDGSYNTTYQSNTVAHCMGGGIFMNACKNLTVRFNTAYDNLSQLLLHSENTSIGRASGHVVNNNMLVARTYDYDWLQACFRANFIGLAAHDYGAQDYNYFARPIEDDNYMDIWPNAWQWSPSTRLKYNLTEWQSMLSEDLHSESTPATISAIDELHFIYNDSTGSKSYIVSPAMVDARGTTYSGLVSVPAYGSLVLIGSGTVIESASLVPVVTTTEVTSIGTTTATSGGYVSTDNGYSVTARGVCWNTTGTPTTLNSKTSNGTGTGTFTSSLTGLTSATTYYVRAYATNSQGTGYGAERSFTTDSESVPGETQHLLQHGGEFIIYNGKLLYIE
jgi:parallel beta-helix repeat protein